MNNNYFGPPNSICTTINKPSNRTIYNDAISSFDLSKNHRKIIIASDCEYEFDGLTVTGKQMKIVINMMLDKAKEEHPEEFI